MSRIMFLRSRLLSHGHVQPSVLLTALVFALGFGVGATLAPAIAVHGMATPPAAMPAVDNAAPRSLLPASSSASSAPAVMAHPAEVVRVLDGDTFEARVNLWPGLEVTTRVRLRGIDAPEMKARCGEERMKAEAARDALRNLLDQGDVGISHVMLDKYGGRVLADASTGMTPNISAALLDAGAVRSYAGGRRE